MLRSDQKILSDQMTDNGNGYQMVVTAQCAR
jgi:hypothetical protein